MVNKKRLLFLTSLPLVFITTVFAQPKTLPVRGNALEFIPNKGQVADMSGKVRNDVLFHCQAGNMQLFLRENGLSYVMTPKHEDDYKDDDQQPGMAADDTLILSRVDMDFAGCLHPQVQTSDPTEGYLNFFLPCCPKGIGHIQGCNTVTYKNIYKNIDVDYTGTISEGLKYNIVVNKGGNASEIKLCFTGADSVEVTSDGILSIATRSGKMKQYIPHIYQDINGSRAEVQGKYEIVKKENNSVTVGFKIASYNKNYSLTIDPWWSTYVGGSYEDGGYGCAFDNANNLLVTGYSGDIDFPTTAGVYQVSNKGPQGDEEAFVIKFSPKGARIWATYYGGTGGDQAYGVAVDASNDVIFAGLTGSSNFPVSAGCFQSTYQGTSGCLFCNASNAFVVKLDPTGATMIWATYYGGNDFTVANGVAVDPAGNVAIAGTTSSKTLPVSAGCFQNAAGSTNPGIEDGFAAEFSSTGTNLWGTYVGGSLAEWGDGIAVDNAGDVYFTGSTQSSDYPTSAGAFQTVYGGGGGWGDAFIIKFNNSGTMQWSTYLGGTSDEGGHGIGVDNNNDVVVTGLTLSTNFPVTAGAYQTTNINVIKHNQRDDFLTKFSPTGSVIWSTYSNVFTENGAQSLTIDQYNNIYVTDDIEFSGPDTPKVLTPPITGCAFDKAFNTNNFTGVDVGGGEDNFITKYSTNGFPICQTYLGGSGADEHEAFSKNIAVKNCRMAVTGLTSGDFIISSGAFIVKDPETAAAAFTGYVTDMNVFACGDTDIILTIGDSLKNITCSTFKANFYAHVCDSTDTLGVTFSWNFTGGSPSTGTGLVVNGISYSSPGTYPVNLRLVDCAGDTLATATNNIVISNGMTVSVIKTNPVTCGAFGSATAFPTGGTSPYTYNWSNGTTTQTDNNLLAGTYTCVVTPKGGCPDTTVFTITNPTSPSVTVSPTLDSICTGGNLNLTASGAAGYTWKPSTSLSASTGAIVTATPTSTTTYTVVGATGGCSDSATAVIKIITAPTLTVTPASGTICSGGNVVFTASGSTTYTWGPSTGLSATTGASVTASPASSTTYTVTGTTGTGCTSTSTVIVTISSSLTASITGTDSVCKGNSTTLTASGSSNYTWSTGATTASINVSPAVTTTYSVLISSGTCKDSTSVTVKVNQVPSASVTGKDSVCAGSGTTLTSSGSGTYAWNTGATTSSITVSPAITTTYTLGVNKNGCIKDTSITVTVSPIPTLTVNPTSATICTGAGVSITASGATQYTWTPAAGLNATTGSTVIASPASTATYTVTGSTAGCSSNATVTVTVGTGVTATITGNNKICSGNSTVLTASGGTNYLWSNSSTTSTINISPVSTATYSVLVSSGTCKDSTTVTVTVNPSPSGAITGNSSICSGDSTTLTASGGGTYSWNTGSSNSTITIHPATTTLYNVIVSNGTCNDTVKQTVTVNPTPSPKVTNTQNVCQGATVTLTASGGATYIWNTGATTSSIMVIPAKTGTYSVIVSNGSCAASDSVKVIVDPMPIGTACCSATITLGSDTTLSVAPVVKGNTYDWIPAAGLSCNTCPNPTASATVTTTYYVTITDSNGCVKKDSITINVNEECGQLFVPNAFSPNGDHENDLECVYGNCIETIDFAIFDRWGNEVFHTTDAKQCWDGKYNGELMNTAVFVYTLEVTLNNGDKISKKGNITLVR